MEVLVLFLTSRKLWAQLSRVGFVVLLAILLAGVFVYFQNNRNKAAANNASPQQSPQPATPTAATATPAPATGGNAGPVSAAPAGSSATATLQPLQPANGKAHPQSTDLTRPAPPGRIGAQKMLATPTPTPTPSPVPTPRPVATPSAPPVPFAPGEAEKLLVDAKARLDAGDPVGARNILNDGIVGERFPASLIENARAIQARANEKLVFSPDIVPGDTYSEAGKIENSNSLKIISRQHAVPWEALCRINRVSDKQMRIGRQLKAPVGPFHVMVSKSAYRLDLFLGGLPGEPGSMYVASLAVGLGKDNSTPTGVWEVTNKVRNPPWNNPNSREHFEGYDPKNPLGGYWIALKGVEGQAVDKGGYGIHGTIDPDSIGKQASMGCVRLKVEDVQVVFDLVTDKSRVLVRD
jgi:hypothetical protein